MFADALARIAPTLLNTAGKQRLNILIYHRVVESEDPLRPSEPTVATFDWQMDVLRRCFNPLSLVEAVERMHNGTLPERAVCVTFDDGYADNERLAAPILRRHSVPATVFVSTGYLNGRSMFNDQVIEAVRGHTDATLDLRDVGLGNYPTGDDEARLAAIAAILENLKYREPGERAALARVIGERGAAASAELMMTDGQLRSLAGQGIAIGAHTVNHPILASVDPETARAEIAGSREQLENLLQRDVEAFAYPNGKPDRDYKPEHRDMVEALGFKAAVATHWGVACPASDRFQMPRFTPWDLTPSRFALRLLLAFRRVDPLVGRH